MLSDTLLTFTKYETVQNKFGKGIQLWKAKLPHEKDFANVIVALGETVYVVGTEQGRVILLNLKRKNQVLGSIKTKRWISGIGYYRGFFWTVGEDKRVSCSSLRSATEHFCLQEERDIQSYSEIGILFCPLRNPAFILYNAGLMRFRVLSRTQRKSLKCFDVAPFLEANASFRSFIRSNRVVRALSVTLNSSHVCLLFNRNHPHVAIFDYKRMKVGLFEELRPALNREVEKPISLHCIARSNRDMIACLVQWQKIDSKEILTSYSTYLYDQMEDKWSKIAEGLVSSRNLLTKTPYQEFSILEFFNMRK